MNSNERSQYKRIDAEVRISQGEKMLVDARIHPNKLRLKKSTKAVACRPSDKILVPAVIKCAKDSLTIGAAIGRGTYSRCFMVRSCATARIYAVKIQAIGKQGSSSRRRCEREASIHHSVGRHPNISTFVRSYYDANNVYIQLEYYPRGDLLSHMRKYGTFRDLMAFELMKHICNGVMYLHSNGIIHRDLKMANIFLDYKGMPRIGDFGLAQVLDQGRDYIEARAGTPSYMSPELSVAPYTASYASDIWALGVLLFTAVCGKLPFEASSSKDTRNLVTQGVYEFPESKGGEAFRRMVEDILVAEPSKRPSAAQLLVKFSQATSKSIGLHKTAVETCSPKKPFAAPLQRLYQLS